MTTERIVIVGGPRRGKSWLARELATESGAPRFCADPKSMVKEPFGGVVYLPEGLAMEYESTRWVAENWLSSPGPWICEGWLMARALRKWRKLMDEIEEARPGLKMQTYPCDRIIVLDRPGFGMPSKGQNAMHTGVMTVWNEIAHYYEPIAEYL